MEAGKVSAERYYTRLRKLAIRYQIPWTTPPYRHLRRYVDYLEREAQLNVSEVSDDLTALKAAIQDQLLTTDDQRQLGRGQ